MCRIHGWFDVPADAAALDRAAAAQRGGGPDGSGAARGRDWPLGGWGLGSVRLAVTDPAGGAQPYRLVTAAGTITVVFNGELYNHDDLRRELRARGHRFADRCDGSVIPALWFEYGPDFVERLDGMFAIALVDERDETFFLATDHIGMKTVHYRLGPGGRGLWFASEAAALLALIGDAAGVREDLRSLDDCLTTRTHLGTRSGLGDVRVLPPAASLLCRPGATPLLRRRPTRDEGGRPGAGPARSADLAALLGEETRRLLIADVPTAVITSGGLDSSLITALAAEQRRQDGPVDSFTVAYRGDWPFDERHHAASVAAHAGTRHHVVEVDPAELPELLVRTVRHLGQPNADPITVSSYALFAAVRAAGYTVALTGDAADEVFGGYPRMRAATEAAAEGRPWVDDYLDALAVVPARARHLLYTDAYRSLLRDAAEEADEDLFADLRHGPGTALQRVTRFELSRRLPAYHLRRVDHLSLAHGVEARMPFCQRSVLAYAAALPDVEKIDAGQVKRALYAAARGRLPRGVLERPKQPFTLPVAAMLRPGQALWAYARDLLTPRRLRADGRISVPAVARLFARQEQGPDDAAALALWTLLVHASWRDQVVDGAAWRTSVRSGVAA